MRGGDFFQKVPSPHPSFKNFQEGDVGLLDLPSAENANTQFPAGKVFSGMFVVMECLMFLPQIANSKIGKGTE